MVLIVMMGLLQTNSCSEYKQKAQKYERIGMAESNLDIGAKYLSMAITYRKKTLDACFYSAFEKPKIRDEIRDLKEMRRSMLAESARKRKHDLEVARERSKGNRE